jgi:hypothetical protein
MTEPLYLFLSLLGIEIFNKYQRDGQPLRWLAWLGGVGALLFLTRFVGLALVAACALVILIQAGRPWLVRLRDAAALVGISVLPMLTWMLRNYLAAESLANKNMSFTAIPAEQIADLVDIFEQLSFPLERIFMIGAAKAALSAAILIALAIRAWSFKTETNPADRIAAKPTAAVLAIYTVTYPAIVLISKVFIDKNVSFFEHRFVAPFFISLVILFTAFFSIGWERVWRRLRAAGFVYGLLLTLVYGSYCSVFVQKSYPYLRSLYLNGGGYTETRYLESDFYNVLQSLPGDQVAFTDNIERLYLYTGKYSYAFYDQTPETLAQVRQRMNGKEGAFFVFFKHTAEWNENTLAEFPEMELFYKHADGSIFIQDRTH